MRLFLCWESIIHKPLFSNISPTFLLKSQWHLGREKGFMSHPLTFVRDHFSRYTFQKGSINQCCRPCSLAKGRTSHMWQGESLIHQDVCSWPFGTQPIGLLVWLKRMYIRQNSTRKRPCTNRKGIFLPRLIWFYPMCCLLGAPIVYKRCLQFTN